MKRCNRYSRFIPALFVLLAFGELQAEGFRPAGFLFYKDVKPLPESDRSAYGRLTLDEDVLRHAGVHDVVPSAGGVALPFFRRAVPPGKGQTGVRRPKVIFTQKKRGERAIYNLELPEPPTGTEYTWLSMARNEPYEAAVHVSVAEKPGDWRSVGNRTVFRYRGSRNSRIRFQSGANRFVRLEFEGAVNFTFPEAGYGPLRRVSEFKADIGRADFKESQVPEANESVFYFENVKRRRIHRLILRFAEERFQRRLKIEAMDGRSKSYGTVMSTSLARSRGEGVDQVIDLNRPQSGRMKLVVSNGDNKPLVLQQVEAYSPLEEIIFVLPEAPKRPPMRVYYGNRYASALQFDIRKTFDVSLSSVHVELGPHQKNPDFGYSFVEPPMSTWVIRILFYLGLLGVLIPAYRVFSAYAERTRASDGEGARPAPDSASH